MADTIDMMQTTVRTGSGNCSLDGPEQSPFVFTDFITIKWFVPLYLLSLEYGLIHSYKWHLSTVSCFSNKTGAEGGTGVYNNGGCKLFKNRKNSTRGLNRVG